MAKNKLAEDPAVIALIEKATTAQGKASVAFIKALSKEAVAMVKDQTGQRVEELKAQNNPGGAKALAAFGRDLAAKLKAHVDYRLDPPPPEPVAPEKPAGRSRKPKAAEPAPAPEPAKPARSRKKG